jgi:Fuc2NAc and GlcNAc transferase
VVFQSLSLLVGSFVAGLAIVAAVLAVSRRLGLVALPNERSFHDAPRPAIGGIAIVVPVLVSLGGAAAAGSGAALGLGVGAGVLALVGLVDDVRELGTALRLAVQVGVVGGVLASLGLDLPLPWVLAIGFLLVWLVNLYNFMDGIDGIAGVQLVVFCAGAQLLAGGVPGWTGEALWAALGATLGFLAFNWPPARIFMGDVGALFLGLIVGVAAIQMWRLDVLPIAASVILLAGFWFDASYTLCVRMLTGQRVTQAHRSHLYQKLAERWGHLVTTLAFAVYGSLWLTPLAAAAVHLESWTALWLLLAVLPLLVAAVVFGAGIGRTRTAGQEG